MTKPSPGSFFQKRITYSLDFEILDHGVRMCEQSSFSTQEVIIPFEGISEEATKVTVSNQFRFWATIAAFGIALLVFLMRLDGEDVGRYAEVVWVGVGLVMGLYYLRSRMTFLAFGTGPQVLTVLKDHPTRQAVQTFVSAVQSSKKSYLRNKYLGGYELTPTEQIERLVGLLELGAISAEEYEALKRRILDSDRDSSGTGRDIYLN